MFIGFEQVAVSSAVLTATSLSIPANATHAELQADTAGVRYTMDGATSPTVSSGMVLLVTESPRLFLIGDIKSIKFIRSGGSDAALNIHYLGGRDI